MTLNYYLAKFRRLRLDTSGNWPVATLGKAPHKPILLLAVLDQIEEGTLKQNFVELTPDLGELFLLYWQLVMPPDRMRIGNLNATIDCPRLYRWLWKRSIAKCLLKSVC